MGFVADSEHVTQIFDWRYQCLQLEMIGGVKRIKAISALDSDFCYVGLQSIGMECTSAKRVILFCLYGASFFTSLDNRFPEKPLESEHTLHRMGRL